MPVLEKCENACRVTADSTPPRPSTKRQRNDDLGTTGNPITVSPSPTASRISREVSSERTQQPVFLTLRRKRPLGAHVEVSKSDHVADMNLKKTLGNPTVEVPNQCTKCGKQFAFKIQLQRHVTNVHRDERDLTCKECGRKFCRITAVYAHKKVVHQNRIFMCPFEGCDRPGYKYKQSLDEHIRSVHTHVRPYVCDTCKKAFVSKNRLRKHNVTHSSENVFHCECGKTFRYKDTFESHRGLCLLN